MKLNDEQLVRACYIWVARTWNQNSCGVILDMLLHIFPPTNTRVEYSRLFHHPIPHILRLVGLGDLVEALSGGDVGNQFRERMEEYAPKSWEDVEGTPYEVAFTANKGIRLLCSGVRS